MKQEGIYSVCFSLNFQDGIVAFVVAAVAVVAAAVVAFVVAAAAVVVFVVFGSNMVRHKNSK